MRKDPTEKIKQPSLWLNQLYVTVMTLMTTKKINIQTKYMFGIFHNGILVADIYPVEIEAKEKNPK